MKISDIAYKVLHTKEKNETEKNEKSDNEKKRIKKTSIWDLGRSDFENLDVETPAYIFDNEDIDGCICCWDDDFPVINPLVKLSEKPTLLFYRGDISLLSDISKNIGVIGLIDPDSDIIKREQSIISEIYKQHRESVIVSGLALGCDTVAHYSAIDCTGKTIAILPSTLTKIYPAKNKELAENIVNSGGLLITEYINEPMQRFEVIKRFIDRDRLQAMFSSAIILIASYAERDKPKDSGARHAMEAAKKYGLNRYVMYNQNTDGQNQMFNLNRDLLGADRKVNIITSKEISQIYNSSSLDFSNPLPKIV
jgi:DNA processing protein